MSPRPNQNATVLDRAFLEAEVGRIVEAAEGVGVPVRVLGSLGVSLHSPSGARLLDSFARTYADIDFAAYRGDARTLLGMLAGMGYVEDREVYVASEGRRGLFDNPFNRVHLDLFYDRLEFCHVIPLAGRLERDHPTLPLAELLLSKLQIVKLNEKDAVDILLLLLDHELGGSDADTINADVVARLCASDWGLWRTTTGNLAKVVALADGYPQLDDAQRGRVRRQADALASRLDGEPKSLGWRTRARVGERVKWWTDVDEVR